MDNPWERLPSWLLTQTASHAHRLVGDGFSSVNARGYHYRLLATLEQCGPTSQADLGRRSGIHLSDMVAAINELADREFVERTPDPADGRAMMLGVTDEGRRRLTDTSRQRRKLLDERLSGWSDDELAAFVTALGRYNRTLDA